MKMTSFVMNTSSYCITTGLEKGILRILKTKNKCHEQKIKRVKFTKIHPKITSKNTKHDKKEIKVSASASDSSMIDSTVVPESKVNIIQQLKMPIYISIWYACNIIFNIYNKQALNAFTCPWLISTLQLAVSGVFMLFLWMTRLQKWPKISKEFLLALAPVALFHTIGHVSACVSFSKMALSFAHIVKSTEPIFSVALSAPILKETYSINVWLSLVPIALGCGLAAIKEISFSWAGFYSAVISNLGMVFRGIYSKKTLTEYKDIDGINLFGLISIFSLIYCIPLSIIVEGSKWSSTWNASVSAIGLNQLFMLILISGLFFHLYNQASYMVFGLGMAPVTFSVGNSMKRVAVVISSIIFFRNPVTIMNWIGTFIAILGTLLYSIAKGKSSNKTKS